MDKDHPPFHLYSTVTISLHSFSAYQVLEVNMLKSKYTGSYNSSCHILQILYPTKIKFIKTVISMLGIAFQHVTCRLVDCYVTLHVGGKITSLPVVYL